MSSTKPSLFSFFLATAFFPAPNLQATHTPHPTSLLGQVLHILLEVLARWVCLMLASSHLPQLLHTPPTPFLDQTDHLSYQPSPWSTWAISNQHQAQFNPHILSFSLPALSISDTKLTKDSSSQRYGHWKIKTVVSNCQIYHPVEMSVNKIVLDEPRDAEVRRTTINFTKKFMQNLRSFKDDIFMMSPLKDDIAQSS